MIESPIEGLVVQEAEAAGWLVRKVAWVGRRSCMDRFFARDGRVVLIEFKRPGGKPTPGQVKEIKAMVEAGVEVHVCDNPMQAFRILGVEYAAAQ